MDPSSGLGGGGLGDLASGVGGGGGGGFGGNTVGGGVPDFSSMLPGNLTGGSSSGSASSGLPSDLTGGSFPGGGGFPGDTGGFPGGMPGGGSNFAATPAGNVGTQNDPALVAPATMNQGTQGGPAAGATAPGAGVQPSQGGGRAPAAPKPPQGGGSHLENEFQQIVNMLLGRPPEQEAGVGMQPNRQFAQADTGTMTDAGTVMMPPGTDRSPPNVQTEPFGGEWSGAPPPAAPEPQVPQSPEGGFAGPGGPLPEDMPAPPLPQPRPADAGGDVPLPQPRPAEAPAAIEPKPPAATTTAPGAAPGAGPTGGGQQPQFNPFRAIADFITNPMGSLMGLLGQLSGQGGFYPGIPDAPASWGAPPTGPQDPRWGKGPGTPGGVGPGTAPVSPQSGPGPGGKNDPNEPGISPEERQRRIRARDLGQPGTYVQDKNGKMVRTQTNPDGSPKFDAEGNPVPAPEETGGAGASDPASFIGQRHGSSTLGGRSQSNTNGLNPQLAQRLSAAGQAYERETGQRAEYGEGYRDRATQQLYWNRLQGGRLGPVARPGHSLHQQGLAMDMPEQSGFTRWLQQGNAQRFGLGFPVRNDSNHIQMQDIRGRAYPYTPPSEASFGTPRPGGAGTAAAATSANPQERATAAHPALAQARQSLAAQLQDPSTARLLAANVAAEVGGQGPLAEQAYMEAVFNRAAARRQTLAQAMTDRGYYPGRTLRLNNSQVAPATQQRIMGLAQRVTAGSNLANFATGNVSGGGGFAGGPMTYNPGTGERFGIEGSDRAWAKSMRGQAAPRAAPYRDVGSSTRAEATPNTQLAMRGDVMSDAPLPGNAVAPFEQRFEGDPSDPNVPEYDPANTSMPVGRGFLPDPTQRQFRGQRVRVADATETDAGLYRGDRRIGPEGGFAGPGGPTSPPRRPMDVDPGLYRRDQLPPGADAGPTGAGAGFPPAAAPDPRTGRWNTPYAPPWATRAGRTPEFAPPTALPEIRVVAPERGGERGPTGKIGKLPRKEAGPTGDVGKLPKKKKPEGMDPKMKKRIQARRQQPPPYEPQLHRSGAGPYYWE